MTVVVVAVAGVFVAAMPMTVNDDGDVDDGDVDDDGAT